MHPKELERIEKYGPYLDLAKKIISEEMTENAQVAKQINYIHIPIVGMSSN
jgi:hypothetical protein